MKLIITHILLNYDIDQVDQSAKRSRVWRTSVFPRADARVSFKAR